jgi:hypothetical protein
MAGTGTPGTGLSPRPYLGIRSQLAPAILIRGLGWNPLGFHGFSEGPCIGYVGQMVHESHTRNFVSHASTSGVMLHAVVFLLGTALGDEGDVLCALQLHSAVAKDRISSPVVTVAALRGESRDDLHWLAFHGLGIEVRPQCPVRRNPRLSRGFRQTGL